MRIVEARVGVGQACRLLCEAAKERFFGGKEAGSGSGWGNVRIHALIPDPRRGEPFEERVVETGCDILRESRKEFWLIWRRFPPVLMGERKERLQIEAPIARLREGSSDVPLRVGARGSGAKTRTVSPECFQP